MAKPPVALVGADARPRVYFRMRGDQAQYAGHPAGAWRPVDNILEAIDAIAGEGAWMRPAVVIWEGAGTDA